MPSAENDAALTKRPDESQTEFTVRCIRAEAWYEGYQTCCGDFDIAARAEARSLNPYRVIPPGMSADA